MASRRRFVFFYSLSGAAGLVYEVTWTRLLTLQLGHTVAAASTVLAAFMGGLAVGAWAAGRARARDEVSSLRIYGGLELAIALIALLLPVALHATVPALVAAYADAGAPARFALVRVVISLVLVGVPAAAMGATFPIAVGALARGTADAGVLYAANTVGAAAGATAAGFWLVPALGLRGTTWVGVALNLAAAGGAFWLAAGSVPVDEGGRRTEERTPKRRKDLQRGQPGPRAATLATHPGLAAAAAAISGFSALVYEVAWTRLLALVIGPTTYAFATMAASFISGLAIGSAGGTRIARSTAHTARWLGGLLAGGAVAAVASAWYAATSMPLSVAVQVADPNADFASVVWRQAWTVGFLMLPMTMCLGASFPLALSLAGGTARSGTDAGTPAGARLKATAARVYSANTAGAIAGALVAGFLLIPALGLRNSIRTAALVAAAGGAGLMALADPGRRRGVTSGAAAILGVGAIAFSPPWDPSLLASGAYKYAPYLGTSDLETVLRAGRLVYYKEGSAAAVSVKDLAGTRSLAIDGKVDASNAGDMLTQRLLGLLPVLLHGRAEEVAVVGLGSGVTVGSALAAGATRRLDVIEISPEVVEASHFFDKENGGALARSGVRLVVGDGRSHLLLSPRRYDVIVSEPSNPWMAGVASLFTVEFFEAAKARLKPEGLLCQWAHTYDISGDDLRSIVRTFSTVFPEGTMWLVGGGDLLLIGARDGSIAPRLATLATGARLAATAAALQDVGVAGGNAPFALLSLFAGGPDELRRFGRDALIQTDDRTALEYSAPHGIYGRTREDNAVAIRALLAERPPAVQTAFANATDGDWTSRGRMDLRAQAFATAYDAFRQAVTLNSRNPVALAGLSDAAGGNGRLQEARELLASIAAKEPDNAAVRIELSRVLAVTGDTQASIETASSALALSPADPRAAGQLASVLADAGDARRLDAFSQAMLERFPGDPDARYYRASALFMTGRAQEAVTAIEALVQSDPQHARAQSLLGTACATLGRRDCAQAAFAASIRANPRDPAEYINAGAFCLQIGDPRTAIEHFASALAIDPASDAARKGLDQSRAALSRR